MDNQKAYNRWANSYDTVINKTRDLEAYALRQTLSPYKVSEVLEIGCGTGKNTKWLLTKAQSIIGVDFSDQMLSKAKEKIKVNHVQFKQVDIRLPWDFAPYQFDLITCSLVLEHIQDINFVFSQAKMVLKEEGLFYIGELHPYKQLQGSKARFETGNGIFELECYIHHVSDFFSVAKSNGFDCVDIHEWFDEDDRTATPRLISMLFRSK